MDALTPCIILLMLILMLQKVFLAVFDMQYILHDLYALVHVIR